MATSLEIQKISSNHLPLITSFSQRIISRKAALCVTLLICVASFLAHGQQGDNASKIAATESSLKTLRITGCEIQYPDGWRLDTSKVQGSTFILYGAPTEMKFHENINLMIQDLKGMNLDLESYAETSEQQIMNALPNASITESKQISSGSDRYHLIIYAGDFAGRQLKWMQHYRIVNEKAYILTFTATVATYDTLIPVVAKVMNSFRVSPN